MENKEKTVEYRLLGESGLRVFPLCLGAMTFGSNKNIVEKFGMKCEYEEAEKIVLEYIKHGGNFIDTANYYHLGESEKILGNIIKANGIDRNKLVLATKYTIVMDKSDPNKYGTHKKNLIHSLDESLKRLQTDYIDILYVHNWDWSTSIESLAQALNYIVSTGKVLHIAVSDCPSWVVAQFNMYAKTHAMPSFICYQGMYSIIERVSEIDLLPMCGYNKIGFIPFAVIGRGRLTGKHQTDESKKDTMRKITISEREKKICDVVIKIAEKRNVTPAQVAVNWAINKGGVTSALIGVRKVEHLLDNLKALDFKLSEDEVDEIDKVSSPEKYYPITYAQSSSEEYFNDFMKFFPPGPTYKIKSQTYYSPPKKDLSLWKM